MTDADDAIRDARHTGDDNVDADGMENDDDGRRGEGDDDESSEAGILSWRRLGIDAAVLLGLAPVLIGAIRIIVVAGGNEVILKTLTRTLNISALLLGTYLTVLPTALVVASAGFFLYSYGLTIVARRPTSEYRRVRSVTIPCLALGVLLSPTSLASFVLSGVSVGSCLGVVLMGSLRRRFGRQTSRRKRVRYGLDKKAGVVAQRMIRVYGVAFLAFLLMISIFAPGMWLPTEDITISENPAKTGYVLEATDGAVTILWKNSTGVEVVSGSDVKQRIPCKSLDGSSYRPLVFSLAFPETVAAKDMPACVNK